MQIQFNPSQPDLESHTCESHREGDWLVFTCPHCKTYERRINFKTGGMTSQPGEDPFIQHQGQFVPIGLENANASAN